MRKIMYCGVIAFCLALVGCTSSSQSAQGGSPGSSSVNSGKSCPGQESCPNCPGKPDICVPKGSSCPRPACPAVVTCGGIAGTQCPSGSTCVDDPNDDCDPENGGADCGGICQPSACGGFAGTQCPKGSTCVDDPSDDCDPKAGGADCAGFCQADDAQ